MLSSLLRGFGGLKCFVERLAGMGSTFEYAPAIVIAAKDCGGVVRAVAGIEGCTDFVQGNPFPGKFYVGSVPLLGDAGDGN